MGEQELGPPGSACVSLPLSLWGLFTPCELLSEALCWHMVASGPQGTHTLWSPWKGSFSCLTVASPSQHGVS